MSEDSFSSADRTAPARALLSVSDKTGLVEFASALARAGVELVSTGGTARALRDAGLAVVSIDDVTGFPEVLDGRVKTLHPGVHGGILARRDLPAHMDTLRAHGIGPIDLVCINLYPFESTIAGGAKDAEAVEQIDIGGPAMVRSAAKNFAHVAVVTGPEQYEHVADELAMGGTTLGTRRALALAAFSRTAAYDAAIGAYFARTTEPLDGAEHLPERVTASYTRRDGLRYGENPHQPAGVYVSPAHDPATPSLAHATPLGGRALSYNNLNDANHAAWLVADLARACPGSHASAVIKHTNPCGAAVSSDAASSVGLTLEGDPQAAYGGILALGSGVDDAVASTIIENAGFLEVVVAPAFTPSAAKALQTRWKNVRLLPFDAAAASWSGVRVAPVPGGALVQVVDDDAVDVSAWTDASGGPASPTMADTLAWVCVKHVTSNAVTLARAVEAGGGRAAGAQLVGVGSGQVDRVTACALAVGKAGDQASGASAASDAFFPFTDGPAALASTGVTRIIQPGGSKRDAEVLAYCAERGIACTLTHRRHFRH